MVHSDASFNLVPFVQFEKRQKHPWRIVTFSKVAGCIIFFHLKYLCVFIFSCLLDNVCRVVKHSKKWVLHCVCCSIFYCKSSVYPTYRISFNKHQGCLLKLETVRCLLEGDTYFKVRQMVNINCQNLFNFLFQNKNFDIKFYCQ